MRKVVLALITTAALLVGCGTTVGAEVNEPFTVINNDNISFLYEGIRDIRDNSTGVHYVVVVNGHGVCMSPRYNADGSLYIGE